MCPTVLGFDPRLQFLHEEDTAEVLLPGHPRPGPARHLQRRRRRRGPAQPGHPDRRQAAPAHPRAAGRPGRRAGRPDRRLLPRAGPVPPVRPGGRHLGGGRRSSASSPSGPRSTPSRTSPPAACAGWSPRSRCSAWSTRRWPCCAGPSAGSPGSCPDDPAPDALPGPHQEGRPLPQPGRPRRPLRRPPPPGRRQGTPEPLAALRQAPRRGSVAHRRKGRRRLSTPPRPTRTRSGRSWTGRRRRWSSWGAGCSASTRSTSSATTRTWSSTSWRPCCARCTSTGGGSRPAAWSTSRPAARPWSWATTPAPCPSTP